jgi:plasmid stability protein
MTPTLNLSPEQEAALRIRATVNGRGADEYALELLDKTLAAPPEGQETRPFYETATAEEWIAAWHEWANSHDLNGPVLLDDRREIIYED